MATRTYSSITGQPVVAYVAGPYESVSTFTIGGSTSAPTPGTSTFYRNTYRDGEWAWIRWEFNQTAAGSAGSGSYLLPLPANLSIDTARWGATGTINTATYGGGLVGSLQNNGTDYYVRAGRTSANNTSVGIEFGNDTTVFTTWGSTAAPLSNASIKIGITLRVPILEWVGSATVAYGAGQATGVTPGLVSSEINTTHSTTFTWDGSGGTSSAVTINLRKVGPLVTATFTGGALATTGTSSAILTANTALPAAYRPTNTQTHIGVPVSQGGSNQANAGYITISSAGVLQFYKDYSAPTFTNSTANCGIGTRFSFHWRTDV